ncbi:MAG: hypothetical protein IJO14_09450 [Clostridia bacterium]|nr:hypothetical protein [Clostridia bacterium]
MTNAKVLTKKLLSCLLCLCLVLPLFSSAFVPLAAELKDALTVESSAAGATANYEHEYYYTNGTTFMSTDIVFSLPDKNWIGATASGSAEKKITNNGYNLVDQDLNDGAGGDYIFMGYKNTTNPANAVRALGVMVTENPPDTYYANFNGKSCLFKPVKAYYDWDSSSITTGVLDMNKGAGGAYIYLYYSTDPNAGPPITNFDWEGDSHTNDAGNICQTPVTYINSGYGDYGVTVGDVADMNRGCGSSSKDTAFFVHTSINTEVETANLRAVYASAQKYINNSSRYTSSS